MRHRATARFWSCYEKLPSSIQASANEKFAILKSDPSHRSLHFKKLGKLWSVRITRGYRALGYYDGEEYIWVWIGSHSEYNQMI